MSIIKKNELLSDEELGKKIQAAAEKIESSQSDREAIIWIGHLVLLQKEQIDRLLKAQP